MPAATAPAQTKVPTGVLPGVVPKRFEEPLSPRARQRLLIPKDLNCPDPGGVGARRFNLSALVVEGVTRYDEDDLVRLWQGHLGRRVNACQVRDIAQLIAARYRKDGHRVPRVVLPPHEIIAGIVRVRIEERRKGRP